MPSRVIRGEINRSDSLSRVSMEAELTFDRLLLAVDDYGRLDARPAVLKAELFPLREDATPERIVEWVRDLASIQDAPVMLYQVGRRPYLVLTGWERHRGKGRRAAESRFPEPPAEPEDAQEILPIPGVSGTSADPREDPSNPPVLRGTRDEGRGTSSEIDAHASRARARGGGTPPPDRLSDDERTKLGVWAAAENPPVGLEDCTRAEAVVLDWARSNGKRKRDWLATVRNGIREGWALRREGETGSGGDMLGDLEAYERELSEGQR